MEFAFTLLIAVACLLSVIKAECPNACSAHGKCGSYDMCVCYRNWQANDCSERTCQFGLAHVDTPKGDLDSSGGALSGPDDIVVKNDAVYPFGTTEQYPAVTDIDGQVLSNTAHEYRECSNKGICDRTTGTCACFTGYDGSACQRASCPVGTVGSGAGLMCSGHGVCETIQEIAARDFGNRYRLWDEDSTMGCVCDGGYTGADCSEKKCKYGTDPLYFDGNATMRYSNYTYQFYTQTEGATLDGNYSLIFYDAYGEDWETEPIAWNATCQTVASTLEALPNNAIPVGSVKCYKSPVTTDGTSNGQSAEGIEPILDLNMYLFSKYTIAFPKNPGKLKQIAINKYLDGSRATLFTSEEDSTLGFDIYPNGFIGEDVDMVPDRCEDVIVRLAAGTETHYLTDLDVTETKLLKKCLGDSDGDSTNNVEVYDWDYGSDFNPHLIKLIDATQFAPIVTVDDDGDTDTDYALTQVPQSLLCAESERNAQRFGVDSFGTAYCANKNPAGFYAVLYYDSSEPTNPFRLFNRAAADYDTSTDFQIYTTTGHLNLVNAHSGIFTMTADYTPSQQVESHYTSVVQVTNTTNVFDNFFGRIDCETTSIGTNGARDCLNKDDYVIFMATNQSATRLLANPIYPNIYQVKRIGTLRKSLTEDIVSYNPDSERMRNQIVLDYSMNAKYTWDGGLTVATDTTAQVYKFHPPTNNADGGYLYATECSNRGICDTKTGICDCFPGYGAQNCEMINALAL